MFGNQYTKYVEITMYFYLFCIILLKKNNLHSSTWKKNGCLGIITHVETIICSDIAVTSL